MYVLLWFVAAVGSAVGSRSKHLLLTSESLKDARGHFLVENLPRFRNRAGPTAVTNDNADVIDDISARTITMFSFPH